MLALLISVCPAGDRDGASAPATRWTHPRGPASRSCMSDARAPESLGAVLWRYKGRSPIDAVPLTWDGVAYLRHGDILVAIDTKTGKKLASQKVGVPTGVAIDGGAVYLRLGEKIVQWRRRNATFTRRWSAVVGADASAPCLYAGELYLTSGGSLVRLRPGTSSPAWKQGQGAFGAPALLGEHVYVLEQAGGKVSVVARSRLDGREVTRLALGVSGTEGLVAVNRNHVCVRVGKQWVIARRVLKKGELVLSRPWQVPYTEEPLVYSRSTIGFTDKARTFMLFRWLETSPPKSKGKPKEKAPHANAKKIIVKDSRALVNADDRKDLLRGAGMPIALGDRFCTGLWCANLNSNRIAWHLHERPDRVLLEQGVSFRPVPADNERLLLVSRDRKELICVQPEVIGE